MTFGMTEQELLDIWDTGSARSMYTDMLRKGTEQGNETAVAAAARTLASMPAALVTLEANAELSQRLVGCRWYVIRVAIEGGATWSEVAEALRLTVDEARAQYTAAIETQERYVADLHDAPRARAVLAADSAGKTTRLAGCGHSADQSEGGRRD